MHFLHSFLTIFPPPGHEDTTGRRRRRRGRRWSHPTSSSVCTQKSNPGLQIRFSRNIQGNRHKVFKAHFCRTSLLLFFIDLLLWCPCCGLINNAGRFLLALQQWSFTAAVHVHVFYGFISSNPHVLYLNSVVSNIFTGILQSDWSEEVDYFCNSTSERPR